MIQKIMQASQGIISKALRPAAMAVFAALLLQACPAPSSIPTVPQPTITQEFVKHRDLGRLGIITVRKDVQGKISRELTISPSLTEIPASAFANRGITAVTIPAKVTSIGKQAFANNRLTALALPPTVKSVGAEAFKGNPGLKSVIISQGLLNKTSADAFPSGAVFTDHKGTVIKQRQKPVAADPVTADDDSEKVIKPRQKPVAAAPVTAAPVTADDDSEKVIKPRQETVTTDTDDSKITLVKDKNGRVISKSLEISSSLTRVSASKFANRGLTKISIPPETTHIHDGAFAGNRLTRLTIPPNVSFIGPEAFKGNPDLKSVNISPRLLTNTSGTAFPPGVEFKDRLGGITRITTDAAGKVTAKSLKIPKMLKSIPDGPKSSSPTGMYSHLARSAHITFSITFSLPSSLTYIGKNAFRSSRIKQVTIPPSVTHIGGSAFSNNELTEVTIPNLVTLIDSYAFSNNELTEVTIPNLVTLIDSYAFFSNRLTTVVLGNSVERIGGSAFANNEISDVNIPNSVTRIEQGAFSENILTRVVLGSSVERIESSAFAKNKISAVNIPSSVTFIGQDAFSENSLTAITIPNSVRYIGDGAFRENPDLRSVTISQSLLDSSPANAFPSTVTFTDHSGATITKAP